MPGYDISIELTFDFAQADISVLADLADRVMTGEGIAAGTSLAVLLTDDDEVRQMNRQFLGIDEPTDVLSFPDEADDFVQGVAEAPLLGDIAIALPTAERQAKGFGHSLDAELAHLLVHGILHLCRYNHVGAAEDEARMRAREEFYLGDLGSVHAHSKPSRSGT